MLLPKFTPTHGEKYPSARACTGAHTTATAAIKIKLLITRRIL
jgi:hypothetical protein